LGGADPGLPGWLGGFAEAEGLGDVERRIWISGSRLSGRRAFSSKASATSLATSTVDEVASIRIAPT